MKAALDAGAVGTVDVCNATGLNRIQVARAMKSLRRRGYGLGRKRAVP